MLTYLLSFGDRPALPIAPGCADIRIGRAPDQDIVIDDPAVSRAHARLFWRNGYLYLEDLGSKHGTLVNGNRLAEPHQLADRDEIQFGQFRMRSGRVQSSARVDPDGESTLVLPVEGLRDWLHQETGRGRFPEWRGVLDLLHITSLWMLNGSSSKEFLSFLLGRLYDLLEARRGAVLMTENDRLVTAAERAAEDSAPLRLSPAALEATLHRREALLITEPRLNDLGPSGTGSTLMAVPMEHEGEVLGVFYFDGNRARGPFSEDDLRFVASLGNLVAAKLVQLRMTESLREQEQLEQELRSAEALARIKGEFLAHMSHEIRTPMTAVLGFAHLARRESLSPQADHCLQRIETAGQALLEILNDILDMSKIEAGKLEVESVPFLLREVIDQAIGFVDLKAAEKGLTLESWEEAHVPKALVGDPLRLRQCLANLLTNAVKFTERGHVRLQTHLVRGEADAFDVAFSVSDTGIGLTPEELERIFLPFEQAEAGTTRRHGGTGLGLAITRRLAEAMGGELSATSEKDLGSTFSLRLPLRPFQGTVDTSATRPARREPHDLTGIRILLAEDHPLNRELLQTLLLEAGCHVVAVADGLEALEAARSRSFDAILLDVEMPGMDGLEVARRIRETQGSVRKPILALTAHALPEYRDRCQEAGMDACLTKPIGPAQLFETLADLTRAQERPSRREVAIPASWTPLYPVMDVRRALDGIMGREDLLERFVTSFMEERERPTQILEALQQGHFGEARCLAHGLIGSSATLGLTRIPEAAGRLEEALAHGDLPWEPICDELQAEMETFLAAASEFLAQRTAK